MLLYAFYMDGGCGWCGRRWNFVAIWFSVLFYCTYMYLSIGLPPLTIILLVKKLVLMPLFYVHEVEDMH